MTIEIIVLLTLLLILMQIFIPVTIDLLITKKLNFLYLFSSRDDVAESSPSYIMAGYAFYLCSYLHPWY